MRQRDWEQEDKSELFQTCWTKEGLIRYVITESEDRHGFSFGPAERQREIEFITVPSGMSEDEALEAIESGTQEEPDSEDVSKITHDLDIRF